MARCERCRTESNTLFDFRTNAYARREKICGACRAEAKENRGLTRDQIIAENARWERIFQSFVDQDYYKRPVTAGQSSFVSFAAQMEAICRV
jgi:hypothetical protein